MSLFNCCRKRKRKKIVSILRTDTPRYRHLHEVADEKDDDNDNRSNNKLKLFGIIGLIIIVLSLLGCTSIYYIYFRTKYTFKCTITPLKELKEGIC